MHSTAGVVKSYQWQSIIDVEEEEERKKLYLPSKNNTVQIHSIHRGTVAGCQRRLSPINAGHPLQLKSFIDVT